MKMEEVSHLQSLHTSIKLYDVTFQQFVIFSSTPQETATSDFKLNQQDSLVKSS